MDDLNLEEGSSQIVEICWGERWLVYHRLQELNIPCHCASNQPLTVSLRAPIQAIQLWSIIKQLRGSRQELVSWLNSCWQQEA